MKVPPSEDTVGKVRRTRWYLQNFDTLNTVKVLASGTWKAARTKSEGSRDD